MTIIDHVVPGTADLNAAADSLRQSFDAEIGELCLSSRRPGFVSRSAAVPGADQGCSSRS
jgi:hypothetical protein